MIFSHKVIFLSHTIEMRYFNYHSTAKKLIKDGKLKYYYFIENHNGISPALMLVFDDAKHPLMPIREHRFNEYIALINDHKKSRQSD